MIGLDLGTVPQWITGAGVLSFTGLVLRYNLGVKKIKQTGDADIRDHYAEELKRVIERQHNCEAREEKLRGRVTELENTALGLISIIRQASTDKVLSLSTNASQEILDMAERLQKRGSE